MLISLLTLLSRALNKQLGFNCNFFYSDENWLQVSGAGENLPPRCYFSVLQTAELYPCSPLLSCLSPTSDPPFMEKIFRPFTWFFVSECFPKSVPAPKRKPGIAERWEMKKTVVDLGHLEHLGDLSHLDHLGRLGQYWSHEPLTKLFHTLWPSKPTNPGQIFDRLGQSLDWIVRLEYSFRVFSTSRFAPVALSSVELVVRIKRYKQTDATVLLWSKKRH